jgi:hypothetical protein
MGKFLNSNPKPCCKCNAIIFPTSNRQKFCKECRIENDRQKCNEYRKNHFIPKGYNQKGKNNNNWRGGIGIYKRKARRYFEEKCFMCGSEEFLCVHHKDHNRYNNKISNLSIICRTCHAKIHELHKSLPKGERLSELKKVQAKFAKRKNGWFSK